MFTINISESDYYQNFVEKEANDDQSIIKIGIVGLAKRLDKTGVFEDSNAVIFSFESGLCLTLLIILAVWGIISVCYVLISLKSFLLYQVFV